MRNPVKYIRAIRRKNNIKRIRTKRHFQVWEDYRNDILQKIQSRENQIQTKYKPNMSKKIKIIIKETEESGSRISEYDVVIKMENMPKQNSELLKIAVETVEKVLSKIN